MLFLLACTSSKDSGTPDSESDFIGCKGEPTVEIGDGREEFVEIPDNAEVIMTHGPQGGWHMLAGVYVTCTDMIVTVNYTIDVLPEETRISDNAYRVQLRADGEDAGYYWNMYGYLDVSAMAEGELDTPPELLCGRTLRLTISVEDSYGNAAESSVDVIAAPDPQDSCWVPE
jgi:hypothetical protein